MFRRRPPRRPLRRPGMVGPRRAPLRALRQAHRLLETGQYAQAYPILKRLADGAGQRGMRARAANLYAHAAHARLEMGNADDAAALARRAIRLLVDAGQGERAAVLLPRMIQALEDKGYHDHAVALRAEVKALSGSAPQAAPPSRRGTLPTRCPSCNAPVRSDEVTWIDNQSAQCLYCASVIRAE
jgi:tetratricopeptide (TPR) repeat protein